MLRLVPQVNPLAINSVIQNAGDNCEVTGSVAKEVTLQLNRMFCGGGVPSGVYPG